MKQLTFQRCAALALAALAASCTMKKQEAPDLNGPSEFGTSIVVAVSPDILEQDGASQSVVAVTARGPNGTPLGNVSLRAEIFVDGVRTDFGTLSARNVVTGGDGNAILRYTAPMAVPGVGMTTIVSIGVTPVGTDYANAATRFAAVRLVPPGVVLPPSSLVPAFTFSPESPSANQTVLFDPSPSQAPANTPIAAYAWDFGNGRASSQRAPSTQYDAPGTYVVRLTIFDAYGRSATAAQTITVSPGADPTVSFVFSPTQPIVNNPVFFNAAATRAAPGRTIADRDYVWDFGDGSPLATGQAVAHSYAATGTFVVTLTATDDAGRKGILSREVLIAP